MALDPIVGAFAPYIINALTAKIKELRSQNKGRIASSIANHLVEVENWANTFQFYGMSIPQLTGDMTIALELATEPRKFRSASEQPTKSEGELLLDPTHTLLLGEPGSGKSTTLKRLALTVLHTAPQDERDSVQYPIVIRLRELPEGRSLTDRLANIFGLEPAPREIITTRKVRDPNGRVHTEEEKHVEMRVDNEKVEDVVITFLNDSKALLLLDGLDELSREHRWQIREEIVLLGRKLASSKIVVSCRSGDYLRNMEGFSIFEICPLNQAQIKAIANRWLAGREEEFLAHLGALPYFDVANRPLMLTQLLLLYKRNGYMPDQPNQIYSKLAQLMLEDWDSQREIRRISTYSGFNPKQKADFLASLAYQLTYILDKTSFNESDLVSVYNSICSNFRLPMNEAVQVANEIQTHNGIIVEGPSNTYEFCHLSFQEYLCADYIVRGGPLDALLIESFFKKPAPLAVSIALSSQPSNWLSNLILTIKNLTRISPDDMASFLSRMLIERPVFQKSELLGFAVLALVKTYAFVSAGATSVVSNGQRNVTSHLDRLFDLPNVFESIVSALRWYRPTKLFGANKFIELSKKNLEVVYTKQVPIQVAFPVKYIDKLKQYDDDLFAEFKRIAQV